jgi:hypothetical protein
MARCVDNQDLALCSLAFFNYVNDPALEELKYIDSSHPLGIDGYYSYEYTFTVQDAISYTITVDSWSYLSADDGSFFDIYMTDGVRVEYPFYSATIDSMSGVTVELEGYCYGTPNQMLLSAVVTLYRHTD